MSRASAAPDRTRSLSHAASDGAALFGATLSDGKGTWARLGSARGQECAAAPLASSEYCGDGGEQEGCWLPAATYFDTSGDGCF